jgi:hypothetical protein
MYNVLVYSKNKGFICIFPPNNFISVNVSLLSNLYPVVVDNVVVVVVDSVVVATVATKVAVVFKPEILATNGLFLLSSIITDFQIIP